MKQSSLLYSCCLLTFLVLSLLTTGCSVSADNTEDTEQQETRLDISSLVTIDNSETFIFEDPDTLLPAENDMNKSSVSKKNDESVSTPVNDSRPKVAIIIDDMGYHRKIGNQLLALNLNLSFSFLPHAPFTPEQEKKAYQLGRDILVHLPMEASDPKWDLGVGGLLLSASAKELTGTMEKNLAAVPHAIGANNHMGSKFTRNRQAMHTVLAVLKKHDLFFVDSVTTGSSVAMDEARKIAIKTGRRHVFLDNVQDQKKICTQLNQLTSLAAREGQAIAICHPYQATLDALRNCHEKLLLKVEIVPVHELIK